MRKNRSSDKPSVQETVRLSLRGYKVWWAQDPKLLLSTVSGAVVNALAPYVGIYLLARLINEISGARDPQTLTTLALALMLSTAVLTLLGAGLTRWKNARLATIWHVQNKVFNEKLLSMDFADVDSTHVQDLRSQIWQNTDSGGWGLYKLVYRLDDIVKALVSMLGAVAMTASLFLLPVPATGGALVILNNPLFILLILALMLAVTFAAPLISVKVGQYWVKYAEENKLGNRLFGFWLGTLGNDNARALDVRIYRQDILSQTNLRKYNPFSASSKMAQAARGPMGGYNALSGAVAQVFVGLAYVFVCLKALGGAFGVGSITQYIGSITLLSSSLALLLSTLGDLRNNTSFLRPVFELLDMPGNMQKGNKLPENRDSAAHEIEFRNVSFQYPGQEKYALRNVSLKFRAGQRLAVVGMNGSGKTTFIKLLCRLYDPTEGVILLDGTDIREIDHNAYMAFFSVVFQDFKLLSFQLGQNVATTVAFDADKARQCLEAAGFGEKLGKLPKGLETALYKDFDGDGVDISGGEAQKIALARALYRDAPFIVLDEPTAALDPVAEFEVYNRMNEMVGNKTAVFISHRLSSCRFCRDIVVFNEGELIQRGSHDALVADEAGMYSKLWHAQAQYYVTEG